VEFHYSYSSSHQHSTRQAPKRAPRLLAGRRSNTKTISQSRCLFCDRRGAPKDRNRGAEQEPTKHRSLPNGSRIIPDSGAKGYGVFDVQNGTGEDAVLSLYDPAADETIRDVYVQARRSVRMKEIPEGTYQLAYTAALIGMVAKPFSAVTEHSQPDESAPHPIHNFDIFSQNQGLWAASYSSKSLIFLVCLH